MISLKSKYTKSILSYFCLNQDRQVYVNELARILSLDPKNTHRKLCELEEFGILSSRVAGKERYFYLNTGYPLLSEITKMVLSTVGIEQEVKTIVNDEASGVENAWLYGSYVQNSMDANSDIDLLIVSNQTNKEVFKKLRSLQKKYDREINIVEMSPDEFAKKRKKDTFLQTVFDDGVIKLK